MSVWRCCPQVPSCVSDGCLRGVEVLPRVQARGTTQMTGVSRALTNAVLTWCNTNLQIERQSFIYMSIYVSRSPQDRMAACYRIAVLRVKTARYLYRCALLTHPCTRSGLTRLTFAGVFVLLLSVLCDFDSAQQTS